MIISDREPYFCNQQLEKVLKRPGVTHMMAIPYYPLTSCQVEVVNRKLKRILEKIVDDTRKGWSAKLNDTLWTYRTIYRPP